MPRCSVCGKWSFAWNMELGTSPPVHPYCIKEKLPARSYLMKEYSPVVRHDEEEMSALHPLNWTNPINMMINPLNPMYHIIHDSPPLEGHRVEGEAAAISRESEPSSVGSEGKWREEDSTPSSDNSPSESYSLSDSSSDYSSSSCDSGGSSCSGD
jgi:hypothetical protein